MALKEPSKGLNDSEAVYLYCLARSGIVNGIKGAGVDSDSDSTTFLHRFSDIAAVVSVVSLEEFCGPSAESRMRDLSWVCPRACRHEEVIEQVIHRSPVLPLPFGTIFSSLESMEKRLARHRDAISRFLDQVVDKEEWAVKGFVDRGRARERIVSITSAEQEEHLASLTPGMRYLREKRMRAEIEKRLNLWLKDVCRGVANGLSRYASDACERKVLSREATGRDEEMILNWAFLVPRSAMEDFRLRVHGANAEYTQTGLIFESSGPWPPYSFSPSLETEQVT